MTIKFIKNMEGSSYSYKKGDEVENAEEIFGPAQARYFLETGHAEPVGVKTEKATAAKSTEKATEKGAGKEGEEAEKK